MQYSIENESVIKYVNNALSVTKYKQIGVQNLAEKYL